MTEHEIPLAFERPFDGISDVLPVELRGDIGAGTDLSGVAVVGDYLFLGADEGHHLQVMVRESADGPWRPHRAVALAKQDEEADIEAIAYDAGFVYVACSHSFRRRRLKPELSARRNRERLLQIGQDAARNRIYRVPFDPATGGIGQADHVDLSKRLRKDPLLGAFHGLPGKENGIDIEGIACRDGRLFVGFRGPVLRDNFVPVMSFGFTSTKAYMLDFVRLDGQGIRDMAALANGFLILSGPVNDAPGQYLLWWWDGNDQIPGKDRSVVPTRMIGAVSSIGGAKAEGVAVLGEHDGFADILVVYDTDTHAQVVRMRITPGGTSA